jgi:tetratricopeptide (TPR) repeat protein
MRLFAPILLTTLPVAGSALAGPDAAAPVEPTAEVITGEASSALGDPPQGRPPSAEERLDAAVRAYMEGAYDEAQAHLAAILNDPDTSDAQLRLRALTYLGEVLYVAGRSEAAWDAYQKLLREFPAHELDPFVHPPDVVAFYNTVRAATLSLQDAARLQPQPKPFPRSGLLPFGYYQLGHDEPLRGTLLLVGQSAMAAGSLFLLVDLAMDHSEPQDSFAALQNKRRLQWSLSAGFWTLHALGVADGAYDWRRKQARRVNLGPGGVEVGF